MTASPMPESSSVRTRACGCARRSPACRGP
jgi:hypothetical protein